MQTKICCQVNLKKRCTILANDAVTLASFVEGRSLTLYSFLNGVMAPERPPPVDGSSGPETKVHHRTAINACLHCFARRGAYVSATLPYTPFAPRFLSGKRTFFVLRWCTGHWGLPLSGVRLFRVFFWIRVFPAPKHCPPLTQVVGRATRVA